MVICIGSGIFFKSDNILIATGGNVAAAGAIWLPAAATIAFAFDGWSSAVSIAPEL